METQGTLYTVIEAIRSEYGPDIARVMLDNAECKDYSRITIGSVVHTLYAQGGVWWYHNRP